MTQKTGQKCTAVRRILVPHDRVAEVRDELIEELGRVRIGNPATDGVRMGPLATESQLRDVIAGIECLAEYADIACGGAERTAESGYFVAPTLLVARDASAAPIHNLEVFGPVATLIEYDGSADGAAEIVGQGGGGLVCSVYSDERQWIATYVEHAAPWHGRIWIGSEKSAEQSISPGAVLPAMVHGGPGRAGGGEELGGDRGLRFYMQRTALQGFRGLLEKQFGNQ